MIEVFMAVFIPLFIIVNPSSTLALFSAITSSYPKEERKKTAKNAAMYAAILLFIFAIAIQFALTGFAEWSTTL